MFLFAAIAVDDRFAHGSIDDLVHNLSIGWRAGQGADVYGIASGTVRGSRHFPVHAIAIRSKAAYRAASHQALSVSIHKPTQPNHTTKAACRAGQLFLRRRSFQPCGTASAVRST